MSVLDTSRVHESWAGFIEGQSQQDYFQELNLFLETEYEAGKEIYPARENIFRAFELTPFDGVKVVILGQDPYHGPGQAHGLAFSVQDGVRMPPSLRNIFKEVNRDLGKPVPASGDLSRWAREGVLLLNTVLTVEKGKPGSHRNKGWELFTDAVIRKVSAEQSGVVFMLWGADTQKKVPLVDVGRHHLLMAPHPSPLSAHRGFIGCGHFSRMKELLST